MLWLHATDALHSPEEAVLSSCATGSPPVIADSMPGLPCDIHGANDPINPHHPAPCPCQGYIPDSEGIG